MGFLVRPTFWIFLLIASSAAGQTAAPGVTGAPGGTGAPSGTGAPAASAPIGSGPAAPIPLPPPLPVAPPPPPPPSASFQCYLCGNETTCKNPTQFCPAVLGKCITAFDSSVATFRGCPDGSGAMITQDGCHTYDDLVAQGQIQPQTTIQPMGMMTFCLCSESLCNAPSKDKAMLASSARGSLKGSTSFNNVYVLGAVITHLAYIFMENSIP